MFKLANFVTKSKVNSILKGNKLNYLMLLGMRSNGKSSAVKTLMLDNYMKKGEKFFYLRRYDMDMKNYMIDRYFANVEGFDVRKITKGKWECIKAKNRGLYLCNNVVDKKGNVKVEWGDEVGYYDALSRVEHMKSLNYPDCKSIIFEEFVTNKPYLNDEVNLLFSIVSTVFRLNEGTVFMIANTISRVNPYFREFELTNINDQKIDTLEVYLNDNTRVGVYLTAPLEGGEDVKSGNMFFGARAKMIKNGEWEEEKKRRLEYDREEYELLYTMVFKFGENMFLMEFLGKSNKHVWFVSKKTSEVQKGTRLISDVMVESDITTIGFIPLNKSEEKAFGLLKQGKIAYSDNLTGTEFLQCYKQMIKGLQ